MLSSVPERLSAIAGAERFQNAIFAVIVANAIVLGLETYEGIRADAGDLLTTLNDVFLGIFVVEMAIRIGAYGRRPQDFFRDGWNVFDFVVVFAAFGPGLRENATALRVARLLRVLRLVSVLPDLRVLIGGMVRALPPIGSMAVLAVLLLFVYGMIGWELFSEEMPERWGTVGESMLTLFTVLTLEGWNEVLFDAQAVHPQSWIFFLSFVLFASFLLLNILIAIIITSIEEARNAERLSELEGRISAAELEGRDYDEGAEIESRMKAVRDAVADLETELAAADMHAGRESRRSMQARPSGSRPSGRRGRG